MNRAFFSQCGMVLTFGWDLTDSLFAWRKLFCVCELCIRTTAKFALRQHIEALQMLN